jgi:MerR family transcriptional regulator, thiopeptide resistance regulator
MAFTVGELAKLTGVTVRALHHYDDIGLCRPSQRTAAGYRLYDDDDVRRLQQVLVLRALGVALPEIAAALADQADRAALLRTQRARLAARRAEVDAMLTAVDRALELLEKGTAMQGDDVKQMFEGFRPEDHAAEVEARWGQTAAYQESARRTKRYGKAEWDEIRRDREAIYEALAAQLQQGAAPSDPAVQRGVEAHRLHIDRWFYPCSKEVHAGLGEMYVADARFTANLDKVAPGLAAFLRDAIKAST